jgi:hypothetical protein
VPCTHRRPERPRALRDERLGPGRSAAPDDVRLVLLPSGPDTVRESPLRGTRPSTSREAAASRERRPRVGIQPCWSGLQVQGTASSPPSTAPRVYRGSAAGRSRADAGSVGSGARGPVPAVRCPRSGAHARPRPGATRIDGGRVRPLRSYAPPQSARDRAVVRSHRIAPARAHLRVERSPEERMALAGAGPCHGAGITICGGASAPGRGSRGSRRGGRTSACVSEDQRTNAGSASPRAARSVSAPRGRRGEGGRHGSASPRRA